MSKVNIANVTVLNNPSSFFDPFKFEITFECYEAINDDIEFKLVYVGSAESSAYDQELDSVLVGPMLPEGRHMFVFEANAPDSSKIPASEAADVTVILLSCSFRNQEFLKIGYFTVNKYTDPEMQENPPAEPLFDKLTRFIDVEHPRVTKLPIKWGEPSKLDTNNESLQENGSQIDPACSSNGTDQVQQNGINHLPSETSEKLTSVQTSQDNLENLDASVEH